jgi:hypothetical protein
MSDDPWATNTNVGHVPANEPVPDNTSVGLVGAIHESEATPESEDAPAKVKPRRTSK